MTYEKFKTQQETKNRNETAILKALSEKPMRFKDLKETTGLSQMGLTAILKRLQSENKIERILFDNHEAYAITKKGQGYLKSMWMILNEIYEMQSGKTNYKNNYFTHSDVNWSLITEVESPSIDYYEFIKKITEDYLTMILQYIKGKYLVKNEDQSYTITEPEKIRGKHIITFEVDLDIVRTHLEDTLQPGKVDRTKTGIYQSIGNALTEDTKNNYRHILFNEERKNIFHSEPDVDDNDKEDDLQ